MPRHKAFVREEALQSAMDLFWSRGYEATSLQELVEHMGIGRSSLYDTFGSKHELWTEALKLYGDWVQDTMLAPLAGNGSARERIQALFDSIVEGSASGDMPCCLLIKAVVTTGERCEETANLARDCVAALEARLCSVLEEAREAGDLGSRADPKRLACTLVSLIHGISVSAAVDRNRARLAGISELALGLLD